MISKKEGRKGGRVSRKDIKEVYQGRNNGRNEGREEGYQGRDQGREEGH